MCGTSFEECRMDSSSSPSNSQAERRLIHYGAPPEEPRVAAKPTSVSPVAVLVCHGMGQQVRYQTIASVADAIQTAAKEDGCVASPVEVQMFSANDDFLARAEVSWIKEGRQHEVHVYEAYWAPLTEGKVSYWETIKFLLRAAGNGLRWSRPLVRSTFKRWMFGGPQDVEISPWAWISLIVVLLFVLAQVAVIAYVSLVLAQQWRQAIAQPLPSGGLLQWLKWLTPLLPGIGVKNGGWVKLVFWVALVAEALFVRYFIVEYVGDVAAYISPYKDSKFDELRHQIRQIGLNVGKVVYGFGAPQPSVPRYKKIMMVGHSLGSVVAYDTLNGLIAADEVCAQSDRRDVVNRTRALITFGSPLDKTAFIFRVQADNDEEWIREKLAAAVQPLIVSYEDFRPPSFHWVNIWSPMDIISGSLEAYDAVPARDPRHVENLRDSAAWVPFYAHVQYWGTDLFRKELYQYAAEEADSAVA